MRTAAANELYTGLSAYSDTDVKTHSASDQELRM
jgi:hypothetical protein